MFRSLVPWVRGEAHPLEALQREMNRAFEDFSWLSTQGFSPRFEMSSDPETYRITAELPGLDAENVKCELGGKHLTIHGEKKDEREEKKGDTWFSERRYGAFSRTITLPQDTDPARISAAFDKGVLTVIVPRTGEVDSAIKQVPIS